VVRSMVAIHCPETHGTKLRISQLSPMSFSNAGIIAPGGCLTLNMSEWPVFHSPCHNADVVSSLSDILETSDPPQRFFLSRKACAGILRRAEVRGKTLPESLSRALQSVVNRKTVRNAAICSQTEAVSR
jgi:hypothetical protein